MGFCQKKEKTFPHGIDKNVRQLYNIGKCIKCAMKRKAGRTYG